MHEKMVKYNGSNLEYSLWITNQANYAISNGIKNIYLAHLLVLEFITAFVSSITLYIQQMQQFLMSSATAPNKPINSPVGSSGAT
jgi:hypothetical protein